MDWLTIIRDIGLVGVIGGIIAFFLKKFIDSFFKNRLDAYKIELLAKSEMDKIKFTEIHEERLQVIKQLYEIIADVNHYAKKFRNEEREGSNSTDSIMTLVEKMHEGNSLFGKNKLLFPKKLSNRLEQFFLVADNHWQETLEEEKYINSKNLELPNENEISEVLNEIEEEFRELVGSNIY